MNARTRKMLHLIGLPAVVIMLLTVQTAHAEVYKYKFVATVQEAPVGNPCGIGPGSQITGTINIDTEQVAYVPCNCSSCTQCFRGGDMTLIFSPLDGCQINTTSRAAKQQSKLWVYEDFVYLRMFFASAESPESSMWQWWYDTVYPTSWSNYEGGMEITVALNYPGSNNLGGIYLHEILDHLYLDPIESGRIDGMDWKAIPPWVLSFRAELTEFELETPATAIRNLINTTTEINAKSGILNSLDTKLDSAVKAMDDANESNDASAVYRLQAFINAVEAQRGNQISEVEADSLVAAAQEIIDMLSMQ